ncbi:MAG: cobalamin biosynthesis protein [Brachymonas sp.]|nr:cobalamin biosynthesis protein [Brachymonas sp.]
MTFFSLLCALLLEQMHPPARPHIVWQAQQRLADWAFHSLNAGQRQHGWIAWATAVLAPAVAACGIYHLLHWAGWPLALAWNVLLLYLTLGLRPFGTELAAIREALERGEETRARQLLSQWQGSSNATLPRHILTQQALEHAVLDVHRHVFGVAAAFALLAMLGLGPAGAVLYRCADCVQAHWQGSRAFAIRPTAQVRSAAAKLPPAGQALHAAQTAWFFINWLPARMTAASFAIVGNFELALENWRHLPDAHSRPGHANTRSRNDALLLAVAAGAIDVPNDFATPAASSAAHAASGTDAAQDPTLAEDAGAAYGMAVHARQPSGLHRLHTLARLIWRSVLLWALLIALITVTHWVS